MRQVINDEYFWARVKVAASVAAAGASWYYAPKLFILASKAFERAVWLAPSCSCTKHLVRVIPGHDLDHVR